MILCNYFSFYLWFWFVEFFFELYAVKVIKKIKNKLFPIEFNLINYKKINVSKKLTIKIYRDWKKKKKKWWNNPYKFSIALNITQNPQMQLMLKKKKVMSNDNTHILNLYKCKTKVMVLKLCACFDKIKFDCEKFLDEF